VRRWLEEKDIPRDQGKIGYPDEFKEKVIDHYLQIYSTKKTAEKFEISQSTVRNWLKDRGITCYGNAYPDEFKEKVVKGYEKGIGIIELTSKYDLGSSTIYDWLDDKGVERQSRS